MVLKEYKMEKEINIPLKLYVNVCHKCEVKFSIIAHLHSGAWLNQKYNYCPYCGAKAEEEQK